MNTSILPLIYFKTLSSEQKEQTKEITSRMNQTMHSSSTDILIAKQPHFPSSIKQTFLFRLTLDSQLKINNSVLLEEKGMSRSDQTISSLQQLQVLQILIMESTSQRMDGTLMLRSYQQKMMMRPNLLPIKMVKIKMSLQSKTRLLDFNN